MRAAWYERQGAAGEVLVIGEMPDPEPGPGEVRIKIAASGINPGDVRKRRNDFGYGMPYPRVIPHSDGAGHIDRAGPGVPSERLGAAVWCYGAQSYRPFGTAAEYTVVPAAAYATDVDTPAIPFWPLLFKNVRVHFVGSDDFPAHAKATAAIALNEALTAGWKGLTIAERVPLSEIARAHELAEHPRRRGRIIVSL